VCDFEQNGTSWDARRLLHSVRMPLARFGRLSTEPCNKAVTRTFLAGNSSVRSSIHTISKPHEYLSSRLGTPNAAGRSLYSLLPPGFPVVPQYLGHTSVAPQSLTEPDKRLAHIRLFTQTFGLGLNGFISTRIRGVGQPTCCKAWWKPSQVYDLRWLRRLSHLNNARVVRCM